MTRIKKTRDKEIDGQPAQVMAAGPQAGKNRGPRDLRRWGIILITVAIAAIPFFYGKYLELNRPDPFDSSLNVYQAKAVLQGQTIGRDVASNARPATLLMNVIGVAIFGYSETGPKLLQMVAQMAALGLMYYTLRRLYGNWPAGVALVMAAFYLSLPPYAKDGNVKEQFMIACMLITACGFILHEMGGPRWWLLISGAAAINTWYFKPTGVSIVGALLVWQAIRMLVNRRQVKAVLTQLLWLFYGAGMGLLPLVILYLFQGQAQKFLKAFPASVVILVLSLWLLVYGCGWFFQLLNRVQSRFVLLSFTVVVAVLALVMVAYGIAGEFSYIFKDIDMFHVKSKATQFISTIITDIQYYLIYGNPYLEGSRQVSLLSTQYSEFMRYSLSYTVPIGLSITTIGLIFARLFQFKCLDIKDSTSPKVCFDSSSIINRVRDQLIWLVVLWWVLDMAMIWVSPRSYVQYYLPPNGSAAILAAWLLYRSGRQYWVLIVASMVCLVIHGWMTWIGLNMGGGLYFRSSEQVGTYWNGLIWRLVLIIGMTVWIKWGIKKQKVMPVRFGPIGIMTIFLLLAFSYNSKDVFGYQQNGQKVASVYAQRKEGIGQPQIWQQIGEIIRNNSQKNDTLYVWGWYPGIYVAAKRECATSWPSYSEMHSDMPQQVKKVIDFVLKELEQSRPLYIVDSQKVDFPYYEHPLFDLWPQWLDGRRQQVFFRLAPGQTRPNSTMPMNLNELRNNKAIVLDQTFDFTYQVLTYTGKAGGPLPEEKARERALLERQRHEAMIPLREFIMGNYQQVGLTTDLMYVYKRKGS